MNYDERKAMVYKEFELYPSQSNGLDEADTTEEAETTKKVAASTPKDTNDIESDYDKDNDDKDEYDINPDNRQPFHSGT